MDEAGNFDGTWSSYEGMESLKYATSETSGVWYAPDESTGFWNTNSEGTGGYWEKDDGSDSGTWEYLDVDNQYAGIWSSDSDTAEGAWVSDENQHMLRLATLAIATGTW